MQQDFNQLISWSEQFNHLPWRQQRSLYKTLVSEIMLQQTTVGTVLNKFEGFLSQFPTIIDLAKATEQEILIAWKGLGYYRRAKNLLAAAQYIKSQYAGVIPTDYSQLVAIPGIGDYTANAILAIGSQQRALAIDTNLERVLARYYGLDTEKGIKLKNNILTLFKDKQILNIQVPFRALNEALMDVGRVHCASTKVNCMPCPLQAGCVSKDNPLVRPVIKKQQRITHDLSLLRVLIIENNNLLCYEKIHGEWLSGQWECPTFIVNSACDLKQYPKINFSYQYLQSFKTSITKYKITNFILSVNLQDFNRLFTWDRPLHKISLLDNNNISTATQKALVQLDATCREKTRKY